MSRYFGNVQRFYVLVSSSPTKWEIVKVEIGVSLQAQSETRWSLRISAVSPIAKNLPGVLKTLDHFTAVKSSDASYSEAVSLKKYFSSFEAVLLSSFWFKVLSAINERNVIIQTRSTDLFVEMRLMNDLLQDLQNFRDNWPKILNEAKLVAENLNIPAKFQGDVRLRSETSNTETNSEENFKRNVIFQTLDFVISDIRVRFEAHQELVDLFKPVLKYIDLEEEDLKQSCSTLVGKYSTDLQIDIFEELMHLRKIHISVFQQRTEIEPLALLNKIYEKQLQSIFMNVCIALRIFCTLSVTVAEGERSFSALRNRLKTWDRATSGQERLNSLAQLAINHDVAAEVDFSAVINSFALLKARKALINV